MNYGRKMTILLALIVIINVFSLYFMMHAPYYGFTFGYLFLMSAFIASVVFCLLLLNKYIKKNGTLELAYAYLICSFFFVVVRAFTIYSGQEFDISEPLWNIEYNLYRIFDSPEFYSIWIPSFIAPMLMLVVGRWNLRSLRRDTSDKVNIGRALLIFAVILAASAAISGAFIVLVHYWIYLFFFFGLLVFGWVFRDLRFVIGFRV